MNLIKNVADTHKKILSRRRREAGIYQVRPHRAREAQTYKQCTFFRKGRAKISVCKCADTHPDKRV